MKYEIWIDGIWQATYASYTGVGNHIKDFLIRNQINLDSQFNHIDIQIRIIHETE